MRYTEIIVENFDADDDLFGDAHPILRAIKLLTKLKPVVKHNPQGIAELMDSIKDQDKDQIKEQVFNFMAQSLHMTREYFDHQAEDLSMLPTRGNWYTRPWEFWNVQALDHEIKTLVRFRESRHFFNEEESDKDMFGTSNRAHNNIRRFNFQSNMPQMIRYVQQGLLNNADRHARAIAAEFFREANFFEKEELYMLAREMFTHTAPPYLHQAFSIMAENPDAIADEEQLIPLITHDIIPSIRNESELWMYVTEMLEDFAEGDEDRGDLEYHFAMDIEGELGNLLVRLIQEAYDTVK